MEPRWGIVPSKGELMRSRFMVCHCHVRVAESLHAAENLCTRGWNGQRVRVQLSTREKNGALRTVEGPKESNGSVNTAAPPSLSHPDSKGSVAITHPATYVSRSAAPETVANAAPGRHMPPQLNRQRP
jgi:hypothetical protein